MSVSKIRAHGAISLFILLLILSLGIFPSYAYELTEDKTVNIETLRAIDVSLYGVKLNDSASLARWLLSDQGRTGASFAEAGSFLLLLDREHPTAPMAGVRLVERKVDALFINERFAGRAHGIFRRILKSRNPPPDEVSRLLEKLYGIPGIFVDYLEDKPTIHFTLPNSLFSP